MSQLPSAIRIAYPAELPVSRQREEIADAIRNHQVVIVAGATGSGKTTQLPKICLELGRQSIGHTQPRRLAARTIAERIAEELGTDLGGLVGYQVRFTDRVSAGTRIKLMTDGILLNELHRDRLLRRYDTIIIDEAHERSLNVDFLLGYLKQLLPKRPDLKVIVTSATIDPESFARHFADSRGNPAPIVEVSGRTFPVELRYRPPAANDDGEFDPLDGVASAIEELSRETPGDVLVFFSGEAEIRDAASMLEGRRLRATEVLPLYGRLSAAEQHKVFRSRPAGIARRIVLATNVAETSLTVPGIRYVVDTGTARISRYNSRSKFQQLPIEAISKASANQRSGRAGRTSEGIAIRLYSEEDFEARAEFTEPEILRTNLASVILQMAALGLGDMSEFPFLQPPDAKGVRAGRELLLELGAIEIAAASGSKSGRGPASGETEDRGNSKELRITKIGRKLALLPVDPRYGRMILEAGRNNVVKEVLAIVAALSIQDPRERPAEKQAQADQAHARFVDKSSDFLTLLNLWRYLKEQEKALSGNQFRKRCRSEFLNYLRVREWADVYRQLRRFASQLDLKVAAGKIESVDGEAIHRSLLAGLLSQLGIRDERPTQKVAEGKTDRARSRGDYLGSRQVRFSIFPGSPLARKKPSEIMSAELVETSRVFARTNAAIDLAWAEPLAGDQAKRSYSEPHWEKRQGSAVIFEKVTLYGLPIVERRRVQLSRIDPALARELFIRSALVEGEIDTREGGRPQKRFDFLRANMKLRTELESLEDRARRRGFAVSDESIFDFYDRRLPASVTDQRSFEAWWKDARVTQPSLLDIQRSDLVDAEEPAAAGQVSGGFPDSWRQGEQTFRLSYRFEPGAEDDGVTVEIPLALLPRVRPTGFDWQVPGLRAELVAAMLKSLPKPIRRQVVPVADWTEKLLAGTADTQTTLTDWLCERIRTLTFTPTTPEDFDLDRVPEHLKVRFAAIDGRGKQVGASRDLADLQESLKKHTGRSVAEAVGRLPNAIERDGLTQWDFENLPEFLDVKSHGNTIRGFPALVDAGSSVSLKLLSTAVEQTIAHRHGTVRLLCLSVPSPVAYVREHLTDPEKLALARSPYRSVGALFEDCFLACASDALGEQVIRTKAQFEAIRDEFSSKVLDALFSTVSLVAKTLEAARGAEKAIESATSINFISPLTDARSQLSALVFDGFVSRTGLTRLRRVPVYLAGITHRIQKLTEDPGRDRTLQTQIESATARYQNAGGTLPTSPDANPTLTHARWLLEELRISLFAQHLTTAEPVSPQRITKLLSTL